MRRRTGRLFMVLGSLLILSSFALLFDNKEEARRAGDSAAAALAQIRAAVKENEEAGQLKPKPVVKAGTSGLPAQADPLTSAMIDGYGYIGYLSIPSIGLELPVMDDWDYTRLNIAPCRQLGDSADCLIIAGHNYEQHFGRLSYLAQGGAVSFTDMSGGETGYTVDMVSTVGPNGLDALEGEEWNLVLYTCTYDGRRRIMVRCKKKLI